MSSIKDQLKAAAKGAARGLFRGLALPEVAFYRAVSKVDGSDDPLHHMSQALSLIPGLPGVYLRREFYRMTLDACSDDCCLEFGTIVSHSGTRIGARVYIGPHGNIGLCEIGDDCLLGSDVHVLSGKNQHNIGGDPDALINEQGGTFEQVQIGRNTWIGNGARILANVGCNCVVAAGAVVVKDVEDDQIVGGNPAKVLKSRRR